MSGVLVGLGGVALGLPALAVLAMGVPFVLGVRLSEQAVARLVSAAFAGALLACLALDALLLARGGEPEVVTLTQWVALPGYSIDARLVFDAASAVMMTLTAMLCGLIGAFSASYLHKDPGYHRFFVLLCLFGTGMMAVASGETLDVVYAGWEVVGLASALLIAYFFGREAPVRHALRAFAVYRVCDVALLSAAVLLHHHAGESSLGSPHPVEGGMGLLIALLLVFASMGKAAAFPFTGWLPRAMEGPTPSSAIFYGALSIHAAPYLLIRAWPLLEPQPVARGALVAVGALTALHATTVGRVQTDIKSGLGYASVTQVGLVLVEIGLGLPTLALVHLAGHAFLRAWQLLRAPSLLYDWKQRVALLGGERPPALHPWEAVLPPALRDRLWRLALERWYLDELGALALRPVAAAVRALDGVDRAVVKGLSGQPVPQNYGETP